MIAALALALTGAPGARASAPTGTAAAAVPAAGSITTFAGGVGDGPALEIAHRGLVDAVRRGNLLFIADESVIRVLDTTTGLERVVLGPVTGENIDVEGAAATATSAQSIAAIALDAAGNVYYSDSGRNRLRRIDVGTGLVRTIAGGGPSTPIPPADGALATAVYLDSPRGIAVDPAGNVYVVSRERVYRVDLSGRITTAVGGGSRSDHGPGPATEFDLMHPADVAFGPDGSLYVGGAYETVRVTASGALTWFCCTPNGGAQGFIDVRTMAFDGAGNLWATGDGGRIRVIDPSGQYRDVPGSTRAGSIAVSPAGEVHVTGDEQRVWRIDTATGGRTAVAGSGLLYSGGDGRQATSAQLSGGNGIAVDDAGNTYVTDGANRIRKVDPAGIITAFAGGALEQGFSGDGGPATAARLYAVGAITVGTDGVYFQDYLRIRRVDWAGVITTVAGTGEPGYTGDGGPAIEARFGPRPDHTDGFQGSPPIGLAFDAGGNLFVADSKAYVIRRIDTNGIITTVAGGGPSAAVDVPALGAWFEYPFGLALSPGGRLTIADTYHDQVKVVDETGIVRLALGGGRSPCPAHAPAGIVSLLHPYGVAYDAAGNLYVADTGHHCVLRVDRQGQATTIAGRGVQGFSGDGGPALGSGFNTPLALAVDGAGDLLVSEYDRVRKITGPAQIGLPTSARAWGWNYFGQVGDGSTADRRAPVPVAGLERLGGAWPRACSTPSRSRPTAPSGAWGFNALGQLGDGTTVDRRASDSRPGPAQRGGGGGRRLHQRGPEGGRDGLGVGVERLRPGGRRHEERPAAADPGGGADRGGGGGVRCPPQPRPPPGRHRLGLGLERRRPAGRRDDRRPRGGGAGAGAGRGHPHRHRRPPQLRGEHQRLGLRLGLERCRPARHQLGRRLPLAHDHHHRAQLGLPAGAPDRGRRLPQPGPDGRWHRLQLGLERHGDAGRRHDPAPQPSGPRTRGVGCDVDHRRPPPQRGRLRRRHGQGVGLERRRAAGRRHDPRPPPAGCGRRPVRGRARRRPGLRRRRPVLTGQLS